MAKNFVSQRISLTSAVIKEIDAEIDNMLNKYPDYVFSINEIKAFTRAAITAVANRNGVNESTVCDKFTRQMKSNIAAFDAEIIDRFTGGTKLISKMYTHSCSRADNAVIATVSVPHI